MRLDTVRHMHGNWPQLEAKKTKYMFIYCQYNAEQNHNIAQAITINPLNI
jgi:hypothetical protein